MNNDWQAQAREYQEKQKADREYMATHVDEWEPSYGFCAYNETDAIALAMALESVRRGICAYGGGNRCDCKYGIRPERGAEIHEFGISHPDKQAEGRMSFYRGVTGNSEQTGCPELREIIHRLLHRDTPLI